MGAVRPAEAEEGAHGAQLVGRVVFPRRGAAPVLEFPPVALEGVLQGRMRQARQLAAGT